MKNVHIIYGAGYGKTAAAMGFAVKAAGAGQTVTIVQESKEQLSLRKEGYRYRKCRCSDFG